MEAEYLRLSLLSQYGGLSVRTLREKVKNGELPHFKIGNCIYVRRSEFHEWMEQFRVGKSAKNVAEEMLREPRGMYGNRE